MPPSKAIGLPGLGIGLLGKILPGILIGSSPLASLQGDVIRRWHANGIFGPGMGGSQNDPFAIAIEENINQVALAWIPVPAQMMSQEVVLKYGQLFSNVPIILLVLVCPITHHHINGIELFIVRIPVPVDLIDRAYLQAHEVLDLAPDFITQAILECRQA